MGMNAFTTACRFLTRFKVTPRGTVQAGHLLRMFPVVGAVVGLALFLLALFLPVLTSRALATVVLAFAIPCLLWWATEWRGLRALAWFFESSNRFGAGSRDGGVYWRITAFQLALLAKLGCVGAIAYSGHAAWFILVPVLSFTCMAELHAPELDPVDGTYAWHGHWFVAAGLCLVAGGLAHAFVGALFVVIVCRLLIPVLRDVLTAQDSDSVQVTRDLAVEFIEIVVLLLGGIHMAGR